MGSGGSAAYGRRTAAREGLRRGARYSAARGSSRRHPRPWADARTAVPRRPLARRRHTASGVCGRADARDVLPGKDAGALGEQVVDVAVAAVRGKGRDVGDDRVVAVVGREDESHWLSVGQRCDPPPVSWARVARQLVLVVLDGRLLGGHPGQVVPAVCVQRSVQDGGHQCHEFIGAADRPERKALGGLRDRRFRMPLQAQPFDEEPGTGPFQYRHAFLDGFSGPCVLTPVRRDETAVLRGTGPFERVAAIAVCRSRTPVSL